MRFVRRVAIIASRTALQDGLVQVMPAPLPGLAVDA
jgi:hypothetical protein